MRPVFLAVAFAIAATPAFATNSAIALSPNTGAFGRAYDWDTDEKARQTAMDYCRQSSSQPDDCRIVGWTHGAYCSALAIETHPDGSVTWGSASRPTLDEARNEAFLECENYAHHACEKILTEVCSH